VSAPPVVGGNPRRSPRPRGRDSLHPSRSAPQLRVFFDKTPRYMPLDNSESAGVMPQTVRGRHFLVDNAALAR
jgi:hypothetical protein